MAHSEQYDDSARVNLARYTETLKDSNFRNLFLAHTTSVLGDDIAAIALVFAVLDVGGSASAIGLVLGARTLSMIVFMLAGGVWADRVSRRSLMMASDFARFASQALTAILLIVGSAEIWHLVILQAANGMATAFFRPASTGLTPAIVPQYRLQNANALLSFSVSFSAIAGAAIAGALITLVGVGWAMAIDAATFLLSAMFLGRVGILAKTAVPESSFLADLRGGWDEVRSRSWVWMSILSFMFFQLLVLPTFFVLGPVLADEVPNGAARWSGVIAATGIGALIGDGLALRFEPRRPLQTALLLGTLVAPAMVLIGTSAPWAVVAIAGIPFGIAFSFSNTLWFSTLQANVPDDAISRVSSYDWMGSTLLRPIGYAIVGPVAAAIGADTTLVIAALAIVLIELVLAASPSIAAVERHAPSEMRQPEVDRSREGRRDGSTKEL